MFLKKNRNISLQKPYYIEEKLDPKRPEIVVWFAQTCL